MKSVAAVWRAGSVVLMLAWALPVLADAEEDFARGYEAYVQKDYSQALAWWRKAAGQGHARAQNGLGVLYRDGLGTAGNEALAVKWFRESAENGYAFAMFHLGLMYRDGRGVAADDIEALKWLTLASTVNYDRQAASERDLLSRRMSAQRREAALARAQAWLDRFFFSKAGTRPRSRGRIPTTE